MREKEEVKTPGRRDVEIRVQLVSIFACSTHAMAGKGLCRPSSSTVKLIISRVCCAAVEALR